MDIRIRSFLEVDTDRLVEILQLNGQYDYPAVEGPEAMKRVAACAAAVFLVAECEDQPCGFIKAVYDGSRALIHLLSVHPDVQHQGIGQQLVEAVGAELHRRGAPSVSVTVTDASVEFWVKQGFVHLPVYLLLKSLP